MKRPRTFSSGTSALHTACSGYSLRTAGQHPVITRQISSGLQSAEQAVQGNPGPVSTSGPPRFSRHHYVTTGEKSKIFFIQILTGSHCSLGGNHAISFCATTTRKNMFLQNLQGSFTRYFQGIEPPRSQSCIKNYPRFSDFPSEKRGLFIYVASSEAVSAE